jgi:tRNA G18 (ribose-2'-O)-methylase SpoU
VSADTLPSQSLSNYQRKFQITSTANLFDVLHTHGDNEHDNEPLIQSHRIDQSTRHAVTSKHTSTTSTPSRHSLIVCASLLDKAPNIAGLARTSEIFAIEKLIVHNRRVIEDPVFRNVSVTAGHWLDIEEIQPRELSTYLRSMKDSGYTVVAVEQTQYSISAEQFTFPEKVLLLLGRGMYMYCMIYMYNIV